MKTGLLYERIEIHRPEVVGHEYGGFDNVYTYVCKARALAKNVGSTSVVDGEIFASERLTFEVHSYVFRLIRLHDRITYRGEHYRVESLEPHRTARKLIITAERNNE